jgi:5-methyltetrahydrofolate--homocysteine methyltransferase
MLEKIVAEKWLTAKAVVGFFPANTVNEDDIELFTDESRDKSLMALQQIRQQMDRKGNQPNFCLADYVAPAESGVEDYIGAFAVTAGVGIEEHKERFMADHDDYSAILLEAIADRLAEALAERMHHKVRKQYWGYSADEALGNEELIKEKYPGIRPAPGYPACPDHTEKGKLWELIQPDKRIGLKITESFAMWPGASVSGWYIAHPDARYFGTGKIQKDQVDDYARRKGMTLKETERWLSPVLGYDPE